MPKVPGRNQSASLNLNLTPLWCEEQLKDWGSWGSPPSTPCKPFVFPEEMLTSAASPQSEEEVRILVQVSRDEAAVSGDNIEREDLVGAEAAVGREGSVAAAELPAAAVADRLVEWHDDGDILGDHRVGALPGLEGSADAGRGALVLAHGVLFEELKALKVVRPHAQGVAARGLSNEVVARVPANQGVRRAAKRGYATCWVLYYLMTSLRFWLRAKLTASWMSRAELALTT